MPYKWQSNKKEKGEINMRKKLMPPNLMKMIREIHPGLKFETLYAALKGHWRREGGGRYGPEEKARQQYALP